MDAKTFLMAKKLAGSGGPKVEVEPLEIVENGTYTAPAGKAYSPIEVNVPSSGGSIASGVKFIDNYDNTVIETWDPSSVASKTALPANPMHAGLVARGWNWSLANIKSYVAKYPDAIVLVGQMYKTASGLTEMDITVTKVTGKTVTCKMAGNKNWGDGTTDALTEHTYSDYGDYMITCDGTSIPAGSSTSGGMFGSTLSNNNRYWCTAIRIGASVTKIGMYALYACRSLQTVVIPDSVTSIGNYALSYCWSLQTVVIPDSITSIGNNVFYSSFPLQTVAIPDGVTSIGSNVFYKCYSLQTVAIPDGVTSISDSVFHDCYSLQTVAISDGVTSIGSSAFNNCYAIMCYDFRHATSVPILSKISAFEYINGICKIIVPDALYNSWKAATNWATYADHIYKASEVA